MQEMTSLPARSKLPACCCFPQCQPAHSERLAPRSSALTETFQQKQELDLMILRGPLQLGMLYDPLTPPRFLGSGLICSSTELPRQAGCEGPSGRGGREARRADKGGFSALSPHSQTLKANKIKIKNEKSPKFRRLGDSRDAGAGPAGVIFTPAEGGSPLPPPPLGAAPSSSSPQVAKHRAHPFSFHFLRTEKRGLQKK